ncbi:hypothetical protein DMT42_00625 [Streptomyces actuosus]|uniref:Uncharacterized protein n=1 Tax=Streptomyces actuosus TaxID=1885 RepID=A0A2U9NUP5_STRAS|nr:hypothetical protein DMT42_00625 [Streptomyces actuosus]
MLVTYALDSGAEGGWHGQASIVLGWFLTSTGMDPDDAARAVERAIGGRLSRGRAGAISPVGREP